MLTATVILFFKGAETENIYNGKNSSAARRICPKDLWDVAARKLDLLDAANTLNDLRVPPANRLEALRADRKGEHSIRINQKYRICGATVIKRTVAVES